MIFAIGRYFFTLAMRAWFKRVYVNYAQPLPSDAPIIFACTHPNSAVDYLFAPLIHRMPTFVLVRGDVFEKPALNAFFRAIYMLPVYRIRDGFSSLNKNDKSFKDCYAQFDKNGKVLIFSEGICIQDKALQPIRKGTARLALDYLHKHGGKKIYVVPMSVNYSQFRLFRGTVMVNYGEPIDAGQFGALYATNANKAYEALTQQISDTLHKEFIQPANYADDCWTERALQVLRMGRDEARRHWTIADDQAFRQELALVEALNAQGEDVLDEAWRNDFDKLEVHAYREGMLSQRYGRDFYLLQMILLAPFMGLAWLTVALPYAISRWLVKHKITDIIFDNTVTLFGTSVLYTVQLGVIGLISLLALGWIGLAIPTVVLLTTLLGIEMVDEFIFARYNWRMIHHRDAYQRLYDRVAGLIKD